MALASVRAWMAAPPAPRRRAARQHGLDWARAAWVLPLGVMGLCVILAMAVGYVQGAMRAPFGMAQQLNSGHLVEMDSRMLAGGSYELVSVTPAGAAQGYAPGQVINMTNWTLAEKFAFAYPTKKTLAAAEALRLHQGLAEAAWTEATIHHRRTRFLLRSVDVLVRLAVLLSSLTILQFARGRAATCAGLYLCFISMSEYPTTTFAGLPLGIQAAGLVAGAVVRPAAYFSRIGFAMALFTGPRWLKRGFWAVFIAVLGVLCVLMAWYLATILGNVPAAPVSPVLVPGLHCATQVVTLLIFGLAARRAEGEQRFVLRVIFASTFFTLFAFILEELYLVAGAVPPGWLSWYFNFSLLGAGIGYPWAIFARRIAGVDFIISRSVAYAISVALIILLIEITEHVLDKLSDDLRRDVILIYGIPLFITLTMSWFQEKMTALVEFLLDTDLRHLERTLGRLRAALPDVQNLPALAETVSHHVAAALHMRQATLYGQREDGVYRTLAPPHAALAAGDPALAALPGGTVVELEDLGSALQAGLVFPLIVFGRVVGLLHCGARPHGKGYDRAERKALEALGRELAIAMVWLDPRWHVPRGDAGLRVTPPSPRGGGG